MSYEKKIKYLQLQRDGIKVGNAGFVRLESGEGKVTLTLQLHSTAAVLLAGLAAAGTPGTGTSSLRLLAGDGRREAVLAGLPASGGRNFCFSGLDAENLGGTGISYEHLVSLRIPLEEGEEIFCRVGETPVQEKAPALKSEQRVSTAPRQNLMESKWAQLSCIYAHVHPFGDRRDYLSLRPEDFVILSEKNYGLVNNSFLLHGYYNYRHLILEKVEQRGEERYYLGVPGNFYEQEKKVAVMYGFERFTGPAEPAGEGDYGYYLIPVEI